MLYELLGRVGDMLGNFVKWCKLILDFADFLRLLIGPSGGAAIVAAILGHIGGLPSWAIVLLCFGILAVAISATIFAIRKSSNDKQLLKYPDLMRVLDSRNRKLAKKIAGQNVEDAKLQQFANDLTELLKVTPRALTQKHLRSGRHMDFLVKKAGQGFTSEKVLAEVSDVIDLHDLGLRVAQRRDFCFRYHAAQLENMPIPPTVAIEKKIQLCIAYSTRMNNLLIFVERYQPMNKALSLKYQLLHKQYADSAQNSVRQLIAEVNEVIREYLKNTAKQTGKGK
jgi:hypothetical protein